MANVLGVKTNIGIRLIIALIIIIYMGLEIGLNILERSWKSFGKSLEKMCGNPVNYTTVMHCFPDSGSGPTFFERITIIGGEKNTF